MDVKYILVANSIYEYNRNINNISYEQQKKHILRHGFYDNKKNVIKLMAII